jgi:hypothetical protein
MRVALALALSLLALPSSALAAGSANGAVHAVIRAIAEEGGSAVYEGAPQVQCRRTGPAKFGCTFLDLRRSRHGRVTVTYSHRHYFVGEPRLEPSREYQPLCGTAYSC